MERAKQTEEQLKWDDDFEEIEGTCATSMHSKTLTSHLLIPSSQSFQAPYGRSPKVRVLVRQLCGDHECSGCRGGRR